MRTLPRIDREQLVREHLRLPGARVVDVGCGDGWLTRALAAEGARAVGLDPCATALARALAEDRADAAGYVRGAGETLPFAGASIDAVVFFNSLHHVPVRAYAGALAEAARVLRPGGLLCIVEPLASGSAYELFRPVDDERELYALARAAIRRAVDGGDLEEALEQAFASDSVYADAQAFIDHALAVDASRAASIAEQRDALRERFERLGTRTDEGWRFAQEQRLNLLRKRVGRGFVRGAGRA